jgi:predicted NAD/FAD-dependent oxidoreductase
MAGHFAIVGAGISGAAAGAALAMSGARVTLFDKGRSPGGRMATRRGNGLRFDHGAQYFTARRPALRDRLTAWRKAGIAQEWEPGRFVGIPGMNAPVKALAAGLDILSGCTVTALTLGAAGWTVQTVEGAAPAPGNGAFDGVVLALPAPQAAPIAAAAGAPFATHITVAAYGPCWALMLAFPPGTALPEPALRLASGPISWVSRDGSKPGRDDAATAVVHAAPGWSRDNLEMPAKDAAADLLSLFRRITGVTARPIHLDAHRWRYARVEKAALAPAYWDSQLGLGACGDWAVGPRVEDAFESGLALARLVATSPPAP